MPIDQLAHTYSCINIHVCNTPSHNSTGTALTHASNQQPRQLSSLCHPAPPRHRSPRGRLTEAEYELAYCSRYLAGHSSPCHPASPLHKPQRDCMFKADCARNYNGYAPWFRWLFQGSPPGSIHRYMAPLYTSSLLSKYLCVEERARGSTFLQLEPITTSY